MSSPRRSRQRAVKLTTEARELLNRAVLAKWTLEHPSARLTHESRADLLSLSVATARRVMNGESVDRATLVLAFSTVGVEWDDAYCLNPAAPKVPAVESPVIEERPRAEPPMSSAPRQRRALKALACTPLVALMWWVTRAPVPAQPVLPIDDWEHQLDLNLTRGTALFHDGDYAQARVCLQKAVSIGYSHEVAGPLACALRISGDLDAEEGNLQGAKAQYIKSLGFRNLMHQEVDKPAILEAIGDVETKLGEYGEAKVALMQSLRGYQHYKEPVGVAMVARDLGTLYHRLGQPDIALSWFQEGMDNLKGRAKPDMEADIRGRRALVLCEQGRGREGQAELAWCLDYWTGRRHARWIATAQLQLGKGEVEVGNTIRARLLLAQSKVGFDKVGDRISSREAMRWMERTESGLALPVQRPL